MARIASKGSKKESEKRRGALASVASRFDAFRPASEVFAAVRAVPTIFVQFDRATRVGGFPLDRITIAHGPSNEGKSAFALGICRSFNRRGLKALYLDAERTTPFDWAKKMYAEDAASLVNLYAERPDTYEDAVAVTRKFCHAIADERKRDPGTAGLIVVDSLRKLVPKGLMDLIMAESAKAAKAEDDGGGRGGAKKKEISLGGRAGQQRAALNAAWMDELVPLMDRCGCGMLIIARETEDPDADPFMKKFGLDYKIGGGKAPIYDSSLAVRIERAAWQTIGEEKSKHVIGERHRATIWKTKIGGKDGRRSIAIFNTANGIESPFGFDRARDLFECACELKVITGNGAWYEYGGNKFHGEPKFLDALRANGDMFELIENDTRARFGEVSEADDDGVVPS